MQRIARLPPYKDPRLGLCLKRFRNSANMMMMSVPVPLGELEWKAKYDEMENEAKLKEEPSNSKPPKGHFDTFAPKDATKTTRVETRKEEEIIKQPHRPVAVEMTEVYKPSNRLLKPDAADDQAAERLDEMIQDDVLLQQVLTSRTEDRRDGISNHYAFAWCGKSLYTTIVTQLIFEEYGQAPLTTRNNCLTELTSLYTVQQLCDIEQWSALRKSKPVKNESHTHLFYAILAGLLKQHGAAEGFSKAYNWVKPKLTASTPSHSSMLSQAYRMVNDVFKKRKLLKKKAARKNRNLNSDDPTFQIAKHPSAHLPSARSSAELSPKQPPCPKKGGCTLEEPSYLDIIDK